MDMSNCDEIRDLLALAASGALDEKAEARVGEHVRMCAVCAAELDGYQLLARGLRRLPTPQPAAIVVERARARAELRMAEETEQRSNRKVLILLIGFAWTVLIVSWPIVRLLSGGIQIWLTARLPQTWYAFAGLTGLGWIAAGAAAIFLAWNSRRERETT
jgi:predicted anti-sigma-YlaC factor YlaD